MKENVLVHSEGDSLAQIVRTLLDSLKEHLEEVSLDTLQQKLVAREMAHPTLIGEEACIVGMRFEEIEEFWLASPVPEHPFPHPAEPEHKVRMVFLILSRTTRTRSCCKRWP